MKNTPKLEQNSYLQERRKYRWIFLIFAIVLFILFWIYISLNTTADLISPLDTLKNLFLSIRLQLGEWFHWSIYDNRRELIQESYRYEVTLSNTTGALTMLALGAMLGVAGAVFQIVFQNPIASPTILGVSSGIQVANTVLVMIFGTAAIYMTGMRYVVGYIGAFGMLALLFGVGLISGRGKLNVIDILLAGSVVSRIVSRIVSTIQYYYIEDEDEIEAIQELQLYGTGSTNSGAIYLIIALIVGFVPLLLLRNSLNVTAFSSDDARSLGINMNLLQFLGLILATVMTIGTEIFAGDVAMLAMLVPFVGRYIFGANMRQLLIGSAMMGAGVMLSCRLITRALTYVNLLFADLSLGTIISVVSLPLMLYAMLRYRRGWE